MSIEFYSENLIDQAVITLSTENALFPVANLKDARRSKVFRSTSNSDNLVLDFKETSIIDSAFIIADKRNGFGVSTVSLEFNGTSNFTVPAAVESLTFSDKFGIGLSEFASPLSYRFCRIVMNSTLGFCELSKVFLGQKLDIGRGINFNWSYKDDELSIKKQNRYGQIFTDIISRRKTISGSMSLMDKDQMDKFFQLYDSKGETKPFFVKIGCDTMINDNRRFSGMVYFNDVPTITNSSFNRYSLSFTLIEAT